MRSAEGKVQEKGYVATFPILVNIEGHPSYFISLKDASGSIKAYSFVSVTNYQQIVGVDYFSIDKAMEDYVNLLRTSGLIDDGEDDGNGGTLDATLKIADIRSAVVDGTTMYYIRFTAHDAIEEGKVYIVAVKLSDALPFLEAGDEITVTFKSDEGGKLVELLSLTEAK